MVTDVHRNYEVGDYIGLRRKCLEKILVTSVAALERDVGSIRSILHGLFQQPERIDLISRSMMIKIVLFFLFISLLTYQYR